MQRLLLLFMLLPTWVLAQQSPVAAGGEAAGSGGSVSFSVGQVVYKHYQGGDAFVNEGVQQVYDISPITSLKEDDNLFQLVAYPNPTTDVLWLEVLGDADFRDAHYQLVSVSGQHLGSGMITTTRTEINMANVAAGSYVLRISGANNQSFKIIKNR